MLAAAALVRSRQASLVPGALAAAAMAAKTLTVQMEQPILAAVAEVLELLPGRQAAMAALAL